MMAKHTADSQVLEAEDCKQSYWWNTGIHVCPSVCICLV